MFNITEFPENVKQKKIINFKKIQQKKNKDMPNARLTVTLYLTQSGQYLDAENFLAMAMEIP